MDTNLRRREFFKYLGLSWLTASALPGTVYAGLQNSRQPANILFILTDQHRQDGVSAYGNDKVSTPTLDQLADEGIRFNNMYTAQPVCAPNRGSILSGLYPHSHGVLENTWSLSPRIKTLAEMLNQQGYDCGYFGKWHLDRSNKQGFSTFPDYPADGRGSNHTFEINGKIRYAPEVITDDVIDFLSEDRSGPFFAFASFYPPHPPYSVPERYEKMYQDTYPDDEHRRIYYANCTAIDDQVKRLIRTLKRNNQTHNTLVIFTSEHGHYFEHRWNDHDKRLCYDVSAVVPLLMKLPGTIPGGQVSDALISSVDLPQTIHGLLDLRQPEGLQGLDISPVVAGETDQIRDAVFIENYPYINKGETPGKYNNEPDWLRGVERAVRNERWKLILSDVREPELYDMKNDRDESDNLWEKMRTSTKAQELLITLHRWGVETGDNIAPALVSEYLITESET